MSGHRRFSVRIASVALALVLGGCGISTSGGPKAISKSQLPVVPNGVTTTTSSVTVPVTIVLLDLANNDAPFPVARAVSPEADQLSTVLKDLLLGPDSDDLRRGLLSAIPLGTTLLSVTCTPSPCNPTNAPINPVTVDLSAAFKLSTGLNQVQAVQQVVSTVSCFFTPTNVAKVSFAVDGQPLVVPIASGGTVSRPVTVADYTPVNCTP